MKICVTNNYSPKKSYYLCSINHFSELGSLFDVSTTFAFIGIYVSEFPIRVLVDEILVVGVKYTSGQLAAKHALQTCLRHLHFLGEVENIEDVLVGFVADGTQQGGDR